MDPTGQTNKVRIHGAGNDAAMVPLLLMQVNEMLAIEGQQHSSLPAGVRQHLFIRQCLTRLAGLLNGQDIMSESPQFFHDGQGKVLVAV
jgi:hypothetical protein